MTEKSNVVFLAHRNDTPTEDMEVLSCSHCKNKMWKVTYSRASGFPYLQCGCCGTNAGHFGWVSDEDAKASHD